ARCRSRGRARARGSGGSACRACLVGWENGETALIPQASTAYALDRSKVKAWEYAARDRDPVVALGTRPARRATLPLPFCGTVAAHPAFSANHLTSFKV